MGLTGPEAGGQGTGKSSSLAANDNREDRPRARKIRQDPDHPVNQAI